jgi:hypothetical protein
MPKTQFIFNQIGAYVGPAPAGSFHFLADDGGLNNDWSNASGTNHSLVFPLNRIISTSFSFAPRRTVLLHLGDIGSIAQPILENTDIVLNLDYYLMGLINEQRLGLQCNIPLGDPLSGPPLYGTGHAPLLSGLYSRDTAASTETEFGWPLLTREPRNLFFGVQKDNLDFNSTASGSSFATQYRNTDVDVYAFGDCYLTSYKCSAGVKQLPTVSTSFICNNLNLYSSGLGLPIPSIEPTSYAVRSGFKFSIPNNFQGTGIPTVLLPHDISLSIKRQSNQSETLVNLFLDYSDIKIQSFDFGFDLARTPLYGVGYKYPADRKITWPAMSNLSISLLPGDPKASSLVDLIKTDENYDISIKMNYQRGRMFNGTAIQYDFIGAKFDSYSSNLSIQDRNSINLAFTTELDPLKTNRGLFISGYLGLPNTPLSQDFLIDDLDFDDVYDDIVLFESLDLFALSTSGYKILY